jgi:hypothetical protein
MTKNDVRTLGLWTKALHVIDNFKYKIIKCD